MHAQLGLVLSNIFRWLARVIRSVRLTAPKLALSVLLTVCASASHAQILRSIANPSFEDPFTGVRATAFNTYFATAQDWVWIDKNDVPGWETTHPLVTCPAGSGAVGVANYNCNAIELWFNNFNGVIPAQGRVLAELNANQASKIYQNVCLNTGESFTFNFAHRGRAGVDAARFELTTLPILSVSTGTTNGVVGTVTASGTGVSGTSAVSIANGWTRYSGTYSYAGATGIQQMGFVAISSAGGGVGIGNFLDDINISLKPFAELTTSTLSVEGAAAPQIPKMRFVGKITAATAMTLTFSSPAADYLTDYDFGGATTLTGVSVNYNAATRSGTLTFSVPAGNYSDASGNSTIDLPLRVLNDTIIEDNEVLTINMPSSAAYPYIVANTTTCGAAAISSMTHTIIDNDVSLLTTKSVSATTTTLGGTLTYTVAFANVTPAVLTVAPLTAHHVVGVSVADAVPALSSFSSWTCTASGGAVCPAASGSGAIAGTATLPVGGTLLYAITAPVSNAVASCGSSITNTATQALTATSAQPVNGTFPTGTVTLGTALQGSVGFVVQPVQATVTSQIAACTSLSIAKTDGVATVSAGGTTAYTLTASNGGPFAADGARVLDTPSAGLSCPSATCAVGSGTAVCPVLTPAAMATALRTAPGLALSSFAANSSLVFTLQCDVTASGQ